MRKVSALSGMVLILLVVPALAQNVTAGQASPQAANPISCSLAGVWYGGSDPTYSYMMSFVPTTQDRFFSVAELAGAGVLDPSVWGYKWTTAWHGEVVKSGPNSWEQWGIQYLIWDPAAAAAQGVDGSAPELDVVHGKFHFTDCNTLVSTIDYYGGYFAFNQFNVPTRTPFVTPVDVNWLEVYGVETIVETYHRMPSPSGLGANVGSFSIQNSAKTPRVLTRPRMR